MNNKCGVQGVKLYGSELSMDSNNKVDVQWNGLVTQGTWVPYLGESPSSIDATYVYNWGIYYKFGGLCYISFRLKAIITNVAKIEGANYPLTVRGLPFSPKSFQDGREFSLSICELTQENNTIDFGFGIENNRQFGSTYSKITSDSNVVHFYKANGLSVIRADVTNGGHLWVAVSGWYPTQN